MKSPSIPQVAPPPRILMGPGPSEVDPRVLAAMSMPPVGHLDPAFIRIMNETQAMLRYVFQTNNRLTLPVSGTGSAGMETCIVNLIEPGDPILVCINGLFGMRMLDIARRAGARVAAIERPWGQVFDLEEIAEAIERVHPKLVGIVHAETSTGAWQDISELGHLAHDAGALLLADCVTSLGGIPVLLDEWGIDAAYAGTQKCLSCPPGLSPVSFSERAANVIHSRQTPIRSWYFDMAMVERYWGDERFYHHTAPISMNYALHEALRVVCEEGLENRWARHMNNHLALKAGLAAMGIHYLAQEGHQLPQLNAVAIPKDADDLTVRRRLLSEFGIEIGAGLGQFKGKAWRIGLMGHTCREENVVLFLAALERCLRESGVHVPAGAGVAAANAIYEQNDAQREPAND